MFDVDALERLHNEVRIKECELERLLDWYDPVCIAKGNASYGHDKSGHDNPCEKQQEDKAWYSALSKHRRRRIKARMIELEQWHIELRYLPVREMIYTRQAWLVFESVLSFVLPNADLMRMIWDYMFDDKYHSAFRTWQFRMTDHLPIYPILPPCNYQCRRKRWIVRNKWKHLIKYKFAQNAPPDLRNEVLNHWERFLCNTFSSLHWAQTYKPLRLA